MTSLERVLTTLGHQEPDRVPVFLLVTMHGARELGLSIQEYFSNADAVVEGQLRMREKYRDDCVSPFFYAAVETEAWGAEVIYRDDGPPNSGAPFLRSPQDIRNLSVPDVMQTPCLRKVLKATEMLKKHVQDEAPVIGVAMSPFSLPVMQMGFDTYLDLIYTDPPSFERLMQINESFCVQWSNAQLAAGATIICYFDPVSSSTIIPRDLYLRTGFEIAKRTIGRIHGPTATHTASGRSLPIAGDIATTGTAALGVGSEEDLATLKDVCQGKLSLLGNLNGVEMCRWTPQDAERAVKAAIANAGPGGGFILADTHGEIPFQVTEDTLLAISDAAHRWGQYPLEWIDDYERE